MIKFCSDADRTLQSFYGPRGGWKCCQEIGKSNQEDGWAVDGKNAMINRVAEKLR
jgi:hypothetical protein